MLDRIARLLDVSPTVVGILAALLCVQLATQLYALVDLARRDAVRGGRKWVWALVIAAGNLPGALAYLVAGRLSDATDAPGAHMVGGDSARRAVDALYGPRDRR